MSILAAIAWGSVAVGWSIAAYQGFTNARRSTTVGHPFLGSLWRRPRKRHLGGRPRSGGTAGADANALGSGPTR